MTLKSLYHFIVTKTEVTKMKQTTTKTNPQIEEMKKKRRVWIALEEYYTEQGQPNYAAYYKGAVRGIDHALMALGAF